MLWLCLFRWAAGQPTQLHFLSRAQASAVLSENDDFAEKLSPFDRRARLGLTRPVSPEEFRQFASEQALEWDSAQQRQVELAFELMRQQWSSLPPLPGPDTVQLILTTGREEGNAAYTRGQAIVLPIGKLPSPTLPELLTHELFHVLSRANPEWREYLYRRLGFEPAAEVELPTELNERRITNPDAPSLDWVWPGAGWPLTYARTPQATSLFAELQFGFWSGQALLEPPAEYRRRYATNTRYIIHPEEILAEHFVLLVWQKDVPDPGALNDLREWLRAAQNE